ncbi:MAG: hypothetical protein ABIK79_05305 [Chloroflexota bacterium]|nr:hypothetical protein [Anaerolineae bacterium]
MREDTSTLIILSFIRGMLLLYQHGVGMQPRLREEMQQLKKDAAALPAWSRDATPRLNVQD